MAGVQDFTDLIFWQRARQWAKQIFHHTQEEPFRLDRRLVEQINGSSESVMANCAEGFGRGTQGEFITFLRYPIGSLYKTQSYLCAAYDLQCFSRDEFGRLFQAGTDIRKMFVKFIQSMVMPGSGVKNIRKTRDWSEDLWLQYQRITGEEKPEWAWNLKEIREGKR